MNFERSVSGHLWWQEGVLYQIYPRSWQDTTGDGIGDLEGIRRRLDYLEWLGIDGVWISPIYPSPMADFGYDVSDYVGIHPMFGTMADFDRLLEETHARGLRMILDLVPNHTSDQHPWFREARASRTSRRRDWYIWRDAAPDGGPPNNWLSVFGGSAWTYDEATGQYYYHAFLREQPDLNWRHPEVQQAILDVMRFWLDRGVDGFRVDVMWHIVKDAEFRDNPENPDYRAGEEPPYHEFLPVHSTDQPEVHQHVRRMRQLTDEYDDRVLIGEVYLPLPQLMKYYGTDGDGAHLPFNFLLIGLPWDAQAICAAVTEYEAGLPAGGWPNWVLGNHDRRRIATRVGEAQARVAAVLMLTLRGTPTIYYGDEIGMQDVPMSPAEYQDPQGIRIGLSRDPARTPMPWDASAGAGFTSGKPWLPIPTDAAVRDVAAQRADEESMLLFYRRILMLRRNEAALRVGSYELVAQNDHGFAFARTWNGSRFIVALNFRDEVTTLAPARIPVNGRIVLDTHDAQAGSGRDRSVTGGIALAPNQAIIIEDYGVDAEAD